MLPVLLENSPPVVEWVPYVRGRGDKRSPIKTRYNHKKLKNKKKSTSTRKSYT